MIGVKLSSFAKIWFEISTFEKTKIIVINPAANAKKLKTAVITCKLSPP